MIEAFMKRIGQDPRISSAHISIYVSLWNRWVEKGGGNSLIFFSQDIMGFCKISSDSTFHKRIRELHEYGYIDYVPSFNHFEGSLVNFTKL